MPSPRKNESQKDFVSRCIPIVMEEGTAEDNEQAAAICFSMWRESKKTKEIRDYLAAEFRGNYPAIETDTRVDYDTLVSKDTDPFFITLPVARVGEVSANGLSYDEELVKAIQEQIIGKGGIMGHIKDEDRNSAFPIEDVDWIGVARQENTLWGKAYVPPGEAREYIRRLKARGGQLATSIYGAYDEREALNDDSHRLRGFRLESLDLAPADRAALRLGGQFAITAQMENTEDDMPTKAEIIAELTDKDVPQNLRNSIIKEWQKEHDEEKVVADLTKERDDAQTLVKELQEQIGKYKTAEFDASLDKTIAEHIDWNVKGDEAQKKVDALKGMYRSRILSELKEERDPEKVKKAADEVWEEMKPLAETIRDALAGPAAIVSGRNGGGVNKLEDTPDARRRARAQLGI